MTTKKELLQKIAELQAKVDEMPDEFKIKTVRAYGALSDNGMYYVPDAEGEVTLSVWDNDKVDTSRLENGQVFLTRGAAQREAKRRQLWHKCRKAMRDAWQEVGEIPDWRNDVKAKYVIYLTGGDVIQDICYKNYKRIHFPTRESRASWYSTVTPEDIRLMLIEEW